MDKPLEDSHDSVTRFNDRVDDYVKYRPTYPRQAIDAILDGLGTFEQLVAADVGAGTGISARLVGDRGVRVFAIEPGEEMRRVAARHPNVSWVDGRAEATGLDPESLDLVLCAQSFHWFDPRATLAEFARILRKGGRLAIMWNRRSDDDPFTRAYRHAIVDVAGHLPAERMMFDRNVIVRSGLFSAPERLAFPNYQKLDLDGLIGRAHSASYVPKTGAAGQRMLDLLDELYRNYADSAGFVTMVYETEVYRSNRL
jgi:SAM-dependent methyltransferase